MSISDYNRVVPENISRLISERGLKQNAVAEWAGYSKQQFSCMLNGKRIIKPNDIIAISSALGVNVNELFETAQTAESA